MDSRFDYMYIKVLNFPCFWEMVYIK